MELHQIKSFVTVARTGNLTRAAELLNTTPPSVSTHIRQLEAQFNVHLFNRSPKGMALTDQGRVLQDKAEAILAATREFSRIAQETGGRIKADLRLGINADPDFLRIQPIVHFLFQKYPDLNLEVATLNTREILKQVGNGSIDMGYVFGRHTDSRFEFSPLGRVDLEIVLPIRLKSDYENADWKKISELPWIRPASLCPFLDQVTALLTEQKLTLTHPVVANDDITKIAFINKGVAATVLERSEAKKFERKKKVFIWNRHAPITTELSFIRLKSSRKRPSVNILADTMARIWKAPI